jgi:hypothetical protein
MLYSEIQELISRVRWLGGTVSFVYPESMPQAVVLIDWGLPLQVIRKTGTMPDILVEAVDEFFIKVESENSQAA